MKTRFLINLRHSSVDRFNRNIKEQLTKHPHDFDLNLLFGLSSYYVSNCDLAISQYEHAKSDREQVMNGVWDFAEGVSHSLNLAYCYQKNNRPRDAKKYLVQFKSFINTLPKNSKVIPGKIYNEARYLILTGNSEEAKVLLQEIPDWPLNWLYDYDPIWQDVQ